MFRLLLTLFILPYSLIFAGWIEDLNLPETSLKYHISGSRELKDLCQLDPVCRENVTNNFEPACFGFESDCKPEHSYSNHVKYPLCKKNTDRKRSEIFYNQADFGYLKERAELFDLCISSDPERSNLRCSKDFLHCVGHNIFFDFSNLNAVSSKRYRDDVILPGQVGGDCEQFSHWWIAENLEKKGYLSSWANEFKNFEVLPSFSVDDSNCDIIFEKPTIVMKLDAHVNMYHHFCDFLNLYATQHIHKSFGTDVDVVWWDTDPNGYRDDFFGVTWKAFSDRKPIELISLDGKRVCFRNGIFPLLARQYGGLFYNMPLIPDCRGSSLVHAFRSHILHRLGIPESVPDLQNVRLTILARSTQFRRFLNLNEMFKGASAIRNATVRIVDYNQKMPFEKQLASTVATDVFVGMHGAGLTHLLFLPDWAAVFEVYHCEDRGCYSDLSRLRGVKYFTWPDEKAHLIHQEARGQHPKLSGDHKKFANYRIDVPFFVEQLEKMVSFVRRNPRFVAQRRKQRRAHQDHGEL